MPTRKINSTCPTKNVIVAPKVSLAKQYFSTDNSPEANCQKVPKLRSLLTRFPLQTNLVSSCSRHLGPTFYDGS